MTKDKVALRNKLKKRLPSFIRQDAHKRKRLGLKWRRPRGIHSKMREQQKGRRASPRIGFSADREVRGLTREGFVPIIIHTPEQVALLSQPFIIAATVGMKKRVVIVKKALEKNLRILNIKDLHSYLNNVEQKLKNRKQKHVEVLADKKKVEEESKKKSESAKKDVPETPEEKEKRELEEKRKVLEAKA
ncbi:MAG: eL32 family ribosomal protein [Nanoarchaeota archaeon]|nr:eL32 family ribosomal protein [Nanoarchaeota archaeon]